MVSTPLRLFLQSLCCDSPWDYAVFWKFQQYQNELLLIWEDGLLDISRPMNPMEGVINSFYLNNSNERFASTCAASTHSGNLSNGSLGVAIAEMRSAYYAIGKGLIGEVAFLERPRWICVDKFMAGGLNSNIISECADELFHQFVAGVKTILLVPLVPLGVLQLGSMDMVTEDAELVVNATNKFNAHQQFSACSTELISMYMENLGASRCTSIIKTDEDIQLSRNVGIDGHQISNSQIISMFQESNHISRDMMTITDKESECKINAQGVIDFAEAFNHQMCEFSDSAMIQNFFGSPCLDEELECFSSISGYRMRNCQNPGDNILQSYLDDTVVMLEDCSNASCASERQVLNFSTDCELHKALGHALINQDLDFSDQNIALSSVGHEGTICNNASSAWGSCGQYPNKSKVECLLEAVVANTSNISDDGSSNGYHSMTSLEPYSFKLDSGQFGRDALSEENQVPRSSVTSAFGGDRNLAKKISSSASSIRCMVSALHEKQPQGKGHGAIPPAKGSKLTDGSKRRVRSGDCQKPRPRDRQLIQDRLKELRELVPNGANCSIDGLLDRTIKHMKFLTSVTDRADKVRQHTEKKASTWKDVKSPKLEGNLQNGTSWALELENERQTCPIVVKDLSFPGQMLIEMLCNDNGRFLEIADVIHRLDLTILNGSMEKRNDAGAWARFIVEASESFHRLDIFWPLMQLLQQNRAQVSSKI